MAKVVCLVRRKFNGQVIREWMQPSDAVTLALHDAENGHTYASSHIEWGETLDRYPTGGNFPARKDVL